MRMFTVDEVVRRIVHAEALGFESAWVLDHLFLTVERGRITGHDPLILLAHAAARTSRIRLGPLVLCSPFRQPAQLAREAAALADASGGRFILGLGAGWNRPAFDALDLPSDRLMSRFEEQATAIRRLLDGGRVSVEGAYVRMRDAEVLSTAPAPPLWMGGRGPRLVRLAARLGDGWNIAWGDPQDTGWLAGPLETLTRELEVAQRDRSTFTVSVGVSLVPQSTADVARTIDRYERIGIDELILSLAPVPYGATQLAYMDKAGEALKRR